MGLKADFKDRAGSSFMEYVIILGVASAVLIGMNTYIKRGVQARLKDMTDYFISPESTQLAEINPTNSTVNTTSGATHYDKGFLGGGTNELVFESRQINANSTVWDISPFQPTVTPAPGPVITPPTPPGPTPTPTPPPPEGGN